MLLLKLIWVFFSKVVTVFFKTILWPACGTTLPPPTAKKRPVNGEMNEQV
jgi:hypothetical protein